jgi:hypothetical protein
MPGFVALLTDFGLSDIYVGVMKGVMASINPDLAMIDITHGIAPQSIRQGAVALRDSYAYFPPGTVFLVIVDPGVGSQRQPIAIRTPQYFFVGPDNGIFTEIYRQADHWQAVQLQAVQFHLPGRSSTFHGRDIFAPVAAHLASDPLIFDQLGQPITQPVRLPDQQPAHNHNQIIGNITHIDHFGNLISDIGRLRWQDNRLVSEDPAAFSFCAECCSIQVGDTILQRVHHAYYEVATGDLLALLDSSGYLEIAVNQGNARTLTAAWIGQQISVIIHSCNH